MQGASPLASPGLNPGGTCYPYHCGKRNGGLPFSSPAAPAFSLLSCPLSPRPPSPVGKGETKVFFMQGAPPLASPGLNPGGTGKGGEPRARRGLVPVGCQLTLPLWYPAGGLALFAACRPCRPGTRRGGLPFSSPANPAFSFVSAPIPPTPFPSGEGGDQGFFHARGFAPCIPGAEPGRHWKRGRTTRPAGACPGWLPADLSTVVPGGGLAFLAACRPCRSGTRRGGGLPFSSPANPAFSFVSAPIPPPPFPGGEGGALRLFYARGSAPCIPGAEPGRHWKRGRTTRPAGACPGWLPADLSAVVPGGGLALFATCRPCRSGTRRGACLSPRLPTLPLACFLSPIPPTPFPGGEGGALRLFYARGFAPCIPGVEPGRHWERGRTTRPAGAYFSCRLPPLPFRHPQGACPLCRLPPLPSRHPQGGLPFSSPAYPAFSLLSFPHPPAPLPDGKGETKVFFMQGASPLASPGLNPWFAAKPIGSDSL